MTVGRRRRYVYRLITEELPPLDPDTIVGPAVGSRRHYLTRKAANTRADLETRNGAKVRVQRSNPITWP